MEIKLTETKPYTCKNTANLHKIKVLICEAKIRHLLSESKICFKSVFSIYIRTWWRKYFLTRWRQKIPMLNLLTNSGGGRLVSISMTIFFASSRFLVRRSASSAYKEKF